MIIRSQSDRFILNHCWKYKLYEKNIVNWHKKQLKLWVVQRAGGPQEWKKGWNKAATAFFAQSIDTFGIDAYTGRVK